MSVRVYNPAKTVADCFKYRRKIGTDVAIEALRDCWSSGRATMDELWRYAAVCRVTNVIRPYLEAVERSIPNAVCLAAANPPSAVWTVAKKRQGPQEVTVISRLRPAGLARTRTPLYD